MIQHLGTVGASTTVGAGFVGFVTHSLPVLQALAFIVSVLVGIATLIWYGLQIRDKIRKGRE